MPIEFDQDVRDNSGFIALSPEANPPLRPKDTDTLLHLLFFLTYTREGRQLLDANEPWNKPEAQGRSTLQTFFNARWPGVPQSVRDALVDAHFAAAAYRLGQQNNLPTDMANAEVRYSEHLRALTNQLFADGHKHEFSMNW